MNNQKCYKESDLDFQKMLHLLKAVADATRLRILWVIKEEPLCVNEIAQLLQMSKSAVSHQLRYLKNQQVVSFTKKGKQVFYVLQNEYIEQVLQLTMQYMEPKKTL